MDDILVRKSVGKSNALSLKMQVTVSSNVPVRLTSDVPRCKLSPSRCNRGSFFEMRLFFSRGKSSLDFFSFVGIHHRCGQGLNQGEGGRVFGVGGFVQQPTGDHGED